MKKAITTLIVALSATIIFAQEHKEDYAKLVNTFIGTDYTGNVYPGAQAPFGMVQLSPDNGLPGWDRIAGYFYPDSTIAGFSHTHLSGTGAGDLYDISYMPVTEPLRIADVPLGVHSRFSHSDEESEAGYYKVQLKDYNIKVELTTTERCGIQRYQFPDSKGIVILNLSKAMNWDATIDTEIKIIDSCTIEGYRFSNGWARNQELYFRSRFSHPFIVERIDSTLLSSRKAPGIIRMRFNLDESRELTIVTALSGTGTEGAERNMLGEAPHDNFDLYRAEANRAWNRELSKIEVIGGTNDQRICFYTALYRTMIAPTLFCDIDGSYRGADGKNHKADGWQNYSTFSLWDTFRAAHPLYTYTATERVSSMINSFIAHYEQHGRLPVWNMWGSETDMMIGYHSAPVIADAYLKGIRGFNAEKALAACIATANDDNYRGIGFYKKQGYIPYDIEDKYNADNWALSRTLEYAYDDYCIALLADAIGKKDIADEFYGRSQNYRNVYNPATTFMQPRNSKGEWQPSFNPDEYTQHICESNAWHYMWSVQHDIDGLIELMGKKRFAQKLDSMFTYSPKDSEGLPIFSTGMIGQYVHGNEPSHHVAYLFNKIGKHGKTQQYVSQIMNELYRNTPDGLCGNEDCGQMSAWYIFSAMGFYPVNPAGGEYEIGVPLFPEARLHLSNGKTFTVKVATDKEKKGKSRKASTTRGKQRILLNGTPIKGTTISHSDIIRGGTLEF